jgi:(S)-2-hydroxyglutarate dehydrogenase
MIYDFIIIGGGIVGISTAWQLKKRYRDKHILVLEKEPQLAFHQTGHNSGVIHAGVYYQPGSLKAKFCISGSAQTIAFCEEHGLPYEQCGKLLVATNPLEYDRMDALEKRCIQNGIDNRRLSQSELRKREPAISGKGALFIPATGITDYRKVTAKMAELFVGLGGKVRLGGEVKAIREHTDAIDIFLGEETVAGRYVVACGGLMADRLARMMQIDIDFRIIPFRGEYYQLPLRHKKIINHLIYPIPDPDLPFLGVHLTRMIGGSVTIGPNAVLGWKREGYGQVNLNLKDTGEMLIFPGFWKVIASNLKSGMGEIRDSLCVHGYLKRVKKYCPHLKRSDLYPYPTGIRAQAVKKDGTLIHDFLFAETRRSLHVCNAPSPAATSALPIGAHLCQKVADKLDQRATTLPSIKS